MKIMKMLEIHTRILKKHYNQRNLCEDDENHENHRNAFENYENQENLRNPCDNNEK